jgi:hypothetical protein
VLTSILPNDLHHPEILPPSAVPTDSDEGIYTGIYTVIVSLILLSGGSLNDSKLERYMKRMQLDEKTPVEGYEKPAMLIKRMEREGYVVRVKETGPSGEEDISWILGSRAKVEIGDDGVRGLTKAVYNQAEGADSDELEKRIARSLGVGDRPADRHRQAESSAEKKKGRRRREERNEDDEDDVEGSDDE